jgi:hypothetical protein
MVQPFNDTLEVNWLPHGTLSALFSAGQGHVLERLDAVRDVTDAMQLAGLNPCLYVIDTSTANQSIVDGRMQLGLHVKMFRYWGGEGLVVNSVEKPRYTRGEIRNTDQYFTVYAQHYSPCSYGSLCKEGITATLRDVFYSVRSCVVFNCSGRAHYFVCMLQIQAVSELFSNDAQFYNAVQDLVALTHVPRYVFVSRSMCTLCTS